MGFRAIDKTVSKTSLMYIATLVMLWLHQIYTKSFIYILLSEA